MTTHIMIDHAKRLNLRKRRHEKLHNLMMLICLVAAVIFAGIGIKSMLEKMNDVQHQNSVFLQCLNGTTIALGDSILHCRIVHYNLIDLSGRRDQS